MMSLVRVCSWSSIIQSITDDDQSAFQIGIKATVCTNNGGHEDVNDAQFIPFDHELL